MSWFRLKLPARGVKIASRRRARVWLKQCEKSVALEIIQRHNQLLNDPALIQYGRPR